jgi:hypothetical protein
LSKKSTASARNRNEHHGDDLHLQPHKKASNPVLAFLASLRFIVLKFADHFQRERPLAHSTERSERYGLRWDQTILLEMNMSGLISCPQRPAKHGGTIPVNDSSKRVELNAFCLVCFFGWTTGSNPLNVVPSVIDYCLRLH